MTPEEIDQISEIVRYTIAKDKADELKKQEEKDRIITEWVFNNIINPFFIIFLFMVLTAIVYFVVIL